MMPLLICALLLPGRVSAGEASGPGLRPEMGVIFDDGLGRPIRIKRKVSKPRLFEEARPLCVDLLGGGQPLSICGEAKGSLIDGSATVVILELGANLDKRMVGTVRESYDPRTQSYGWKGKGVFSVDRVKVYEGEFANNGFGPQGVYFFADGGRYEGRFSGSMNMPPRIEGAGVYTDPKGRSEKVQLPPDSPVDAAWAGWVQAPKAKAPAVLEPAAEAFAAAWSSSAGSTCEIREPSMVLDAVYTGGCRDGVAEGEGRLRAVTPSGKFFFSGNFLRGRPRGRGRLIREDNGLIETVCDFESLDDVIEPSGLDCSIRTHKPGVQGAGFLAYEGGLWRGLAWRDGTRRQDNGDIERAYWMPVEVVQGTGFVQRSSGFRDTKSLEATADSRWMESYLIFADTEGTIVTRYAYPAAKAAQLLELARTSSLSYAKGYAKQAMLADPSSEAARTAYEAITGEIERKAAERERELDALRKQNAEALEDARRNAPEEESFSDKIGRAAQSAARSTVKDMQSRRRFQSDPDSNTVREGALRRDEALDAYRGRK